MNNSYKNWLKGGLLSACAVMGLAACSDDHFDVVVNSEAEQQTLWQNIQSDSLLTDFAYILENTTFYKDKLDVVKDSTVTKMTYAEFLNSNQTMTVWAPVNGTFGTEWKSLLSEIKELYASDPYAATAKEFKFAEQYIRQHITRFNFESSLTSQEVCLMNGKLVDYNPLDKMFDGVAYQSGSASVPCANGILHKIVEPAVYKYNIYDYLESDARFSKLFEVLSDSLYDITQFDPDQSTAGAMNNEGKMEYVDSVYSNHNTLLNNARAQIKNEDSLYVALLPTNDAYEAAIEKLKTMFNYKKSYKGSWSNTQSNWTYSKTFTQEELDSLAKTNAEKLFFANMYFSPAYMGEIARNNHEAIKDYCLNNDSLIFTTDIVLYNAAAPGINPAFTNADGSVSDAIVASNGLIYTVDEYHVDPAYSFIEKQDLSFLTSTSMAACNSEHVSLTKDYRNDSIVGAEDVESFTRFKRTGTGKYSFDLKLPALASGLYKISAIMVPTAAHTLYEAELVNNKQEPYVEQIKFTAYVLDDSSKEGKALAKSSKIEVPSDAVTKVVLFEKFNLVNSYKDLPQELESFPRLKFEVGTNDAGTKAKPKCEALNIYKIIIEPYREESANE